MHEQGTQLILLYFSYLAAVFVHSLLQMYFYLFLFSLQPRVIKVRAKTSLKLVEEDGSTHNSLQSVKVKLLLLQHSTIIPTFFKIISHLQ